MRHTPRRESRAITIALASYQRVLLLYPASFRQRFGHELLQVFRASCRAVEHERGGWGVLWLWFVTLPDILANATRERFFTFSRTTQEFHMQAATLARLGGIMTFIAVFFQIIALAILAVWGSGHKLLPRHAAESASQIAFVLILVGLAAIQHTQIGRWLWGSIAAFMLASAFIIHPLPGIPGLLSVFAEQGVAAPVVWLWAYAVIFSLGMLAASIFTLRERALGRWRIAPLLMSLWVVLSVVVWTLVSNIINVRFQGSMDYAGEGIVKEMLNAGIVLPGWLLLMGTGLGLLRVAQQSTAQPAAQPSDAVQ